MEKTWAWKPWFLLSRMVTGAKAARMVRTWTWGLGVGAGKGNRDLPPSSSHQPVHGYRVNISIRGCHLTPLYRERVSLLAVSGGMRKRSLQEKAALGRRKVFFVYNLQNSFWSVLKVGRAFAGPEEQSGGGGTATCAHACTCMCMRTHNLDYLCAI